MAQPPPPPRFVTWLVGIALVFALLLLALFLLVEPLVGMIVGGVLGLMLAAVWHSNPTLRQTIMGINVRSALFGTVPTSPIEHIRPIVAATELTLIVAAALIATGRGYHLDKYIDRLAGTEAEFLTSSVYFASASLREYGYIPKWQPWLESGEPLIHGPFAFVLNPFSAVPGLLLGGVQGILVSVVLYAILAGVGGWFLGWVLGCGSLARVLLALLMLGKGNMHAMIGSGFFQLGNSQAYFPWLMAGTLAIFWLPRKRWPVVLTALTFALIFLAGNIWYTLPMLVCVALMALYYGLMTEFDVAALRRLAVAGALAVGLSASTLLPIWLERDHIEHPNVAAGGDVTPLRQIIPLYFDGSTERYIQIFTSQYSSTQNVEISLALVALTYYSYVVPLWFLALIFVVIPPIPYLLHRSGRAGRRGLWLVGGLMIVLCTLWGAGGHPLFIWLYWHIPLLGEWGYVGRALAVASFWIAVLAALRVDGLWRALSPRLLIPFFLNKPVSMTIAVKTRMSIRFILVAVLIAACAAAAYDVSRLWGHFPLTHQPRYRDSVCINWLRTHSPPDSQLTVWRGGYDTIFTYLDNHVRKFNVEVAYTPLPLPSTIGDLAPLRFRSLPEYALPWVSNERAWLVTQGYRPVPGSQLLDRQYCLWRKADALPYAYTVPLDVVMAMEDETLNLSHVSPVTALERRPDEIALVGQADARTPVALTVQELAYPGWLVELDGRPAALDVLGGQIAVQLPPDGRLHTVYFAFRPQLFYLGAAITLLTCGVCLLILLMPRRKLVY